MRRFFLGTAAAVILLATTSVRSAGLSPDAAPYAPRLVVDEDSVCQAFLDAATDAFRQSSLKLDLSVAGWPVTVNWMRFRSTDTLERADPRRLTYREVDLDGDGKRELLAVIGESHGWRGDVYHFLRAPPMDESSPDSAGLTDHVRAKGSALRDVAWAPPAVLEVAGKYFLLDADDDSEVTLSRIPAIGGLERTCVVRLFPYGDLLGPLKGTAVEDFFRLVGQIVGGYGYCGTLDAGGRLWIEARDAQKHTAWRQWALRNENGGPYNSRAEVDAALERWGRESLWNYRLYRRLHGSLDAAIAALSAHYEATWRAPAAAAQEEASRTIDQVLRRHFVFSKSAPTAPPYPTASLEPLLLAGGPREEIERLLAKNPGIAGRTITALDGKPREALIFFALEHPTVLRRLLEVGAPANAPNEFGKTALMYAAQFDLVDTAKVLLDYGADVNAQTEQEPGCEINVAIGERTALMYVAENASLPLLELILQAGANPQARDSRGGSVLDYLSRNRVMSDAARAVAEALLRR
jgi:hypothetical protein